MGKGKRRPSPFPTRTRQAAGPMPKPASECVVLATIHPGQVSAYFFTGISASILVDTGGERRIVGMLQEWSSANVSEARNTIVRKFLDEFDRQADWLLFIDSDMAFEPADVYGVMDAADPQTRPVVGGLCFGMQNGELFPTLWHLGQTEDGEPVTVRVDEYDDNTLTPVAATGAAFLLIHRSVLRKVADYNDGAGFNRTFPWFQETEMGGRPVGEDITFCLRALSVGAPIHVHTGVQIGHHKSTVLTAAMFRAQHPKEADDNG